MNYPDSKISHTILEFGKVLINELPDNHSKQELEAMLSLIITVWNAAVIDQWHNTNKNTQDVLATLSSMPNEAQLTIKRLFKRKQKRFADDHRAVGNHWVTERNGELIFGCDARAKPESPALH